MGINDINSLSHTKWNCKYHIVFKKARETAKNEEKRRKRLVLIRMIREPAGREKSSRRSPIS